jgi:hypothetical protein
MMQVIPLEQTIIMLHWVKLILLLHNDCSLCSYYSFKTLKSIHSCIHKMPFCFSSETLFQLHNSSPNVNCLLTASDAKQPFQLMQCC